MSFFISCFFFLYCKVAMLFPCNKGKVFCLNAPSFLPQAVPFSQTHSWTNNLPLDLNKFVTWKLWNQIKVTILTTDHNKQVSTPHLPRHRTMSYLICYCSSVSPATPKWNLKNKKSHCLCICSVVGRYETVWGLRLQGGGGIISRQHLRPQVWHCLILPKHD